MKVTTLAILGVLSLNIAHAEGIKAVNNQIGLSFGGQHIDYVEKDTYNVTSDGILDSEKGWQPGLKLHYSLQGDRLGIKDLYFKASYAYAKGMTDYKGYLQNLNTGALTPYNTETHTSSTDAQLKLGKGFLVGSKTQLTPYVAYNYREWERDMSFDPYGYLEMYSHDAASVGLLTQYAFTPNLVGSLDFSVGYMFNAQMVVENYYKFDLGKRPVYALELGLDYAITKAWHVFGNMQYMQYNYGESNTVPTVIGNMVEPNSKSKILQFYVGAAYAF
ncbi:hypothetical protein VVD49_20695 [Uliginosibacterium sp. H3]|uniref:Uncharacterized protein n=1 Tax=Uliginosibacterium silvisoli TaxID=3114758 RepID=A0ABU6K8X0_9RHOO|nr:hypothetical protein [Uliginosibacterium sp. H3]